MARSKIVTSLDFLVAKVRARHAAIFEGSRLLALLRFRTMAELAHELLPGQPLSGPADFERRLVEKYADDVALLWHYLDGPRERLIWSAGVRLAVENLKVMLRSRAANSSVPVDSLPLVRLPQPFDEVYAAVPRQPSPREVVAAIREPIIRSSAEQALLKYADQPLPLVLEAGLDDGYFRLLGDVLRQLDGNDRKAVEPLLENESRIHNLMFVLRGRSDGVDGSLLISLASPSPVEGKVSLWLSRMAKVGGSGAPGSAAIREMIAEAPADLRRVAEESGPADLPTIERRLWIWYYGQAGRIFRSSFFDIGAIYAYVVKRRLELANLITVVEALRYDMSLEETRRRLLDPLSKF